MAPRCDSSSVTVELAPVPAWRVCGRCGHVWRSRSRGLRFRCRRCEQQARNAALAAAQACTVGTRP
jgi:tRNA(Ile2) C34 agmatinyltransferase TiaS